MKRSGGAAGLLAAEVVKEEAGEGREGWEMWFMGLLDGEGRRRGFLKERQYCCSGVRRVEGIEGSFVCGSGRTGAAI